MSRLKKPKWSKPKLIILTRGEPWENVLSACKGNAYVAWSKSKNNSRCREVGCGACASTRSS